MARIIAQPRFSFRKHTEIYECEFPATCADPFRPAAEFFEARGARNLVVEPEGLRFERGNTLSSFFRANNRFHRQQVFIRLAGGNAARTLRCEFKCFDPYPNLYLFFPLHREVEQLEDFLGLSTPMSAWQPRVAPKKTSGATALHPLYRLLYWIYRLVSGTRYRIGRRLTPAGLLVLLAFVITAMTGFDTENTVAYQAFAPMLFLLLVAIAGCWVFRARFSATRQLPRFATVGRPFHYSVTVRNLTSKTQSDLTLLEELADPRPAFPEWLAAQRAVERKTRTFRFSGRRASNPFRPATVKPAAVPPLRASEQAEVRVELTPLRRGLVRFTGVRLARTDPLGLSRAFSKVPLPQTVLILPKRYPLPDIALPGTLKYQEGGVALASNVGRSEEFVALRDYRRGDPLRHIHWRSWAKAGKPIVKEFEDEFFVRHALVLDTFTADPHSDAFEEAVAVAASFACTIQTQESLLDLLFVGPQAYCFTAGRGLAHADQMLEILAAVRACADKPFRELEHLVIDHAAVVSGCICVLLAWDEERRKFVEKLQALGVPLLVLVICEAGKAKPLETGSPGVRPARFHVLEAGKIEEGLGTVAGMAVG